MLKEMTLGRYSPGKSLLHRSDPRTKIALALGVMTAIFLVKGYPALLFLLVVTFALAAKSGKPIKHSLRGLKLILSLSAVAVVVNLLSIKGTPVVDYGVLRYVSQEGLNISARMVLRLVLLAGTASLLTLTTTPFALTDGLERLLKPLNRLGISVSELSMMMLIALRFMPVIVEEAEKQIRIQSSRSDDFNTGSLLRRVRSYPPLLLPLFAGVVRRGDAMATAMEARCYRGSTGRTRMRQLEFRAADLVCVGVTVVVMFIVIGVEYM
jgi:energy-coupling factor transport system permease protein